MVKYDKDIDCRSIGTKNLKDRKIQDFLRDRFDRHIQSADAELKFMKPLYEKAALYFEGHQFKVGSGLITEPMMEFAKNNGVGTDQLRKDDNNVVWYPDNIIKPAIDAIVGEYTDVEKAVSVTSGGIERTTHVAAKYKAIIEYHNDHIAGIDEDDEENMWIDYRIPAIETMILMGLAWSNIDFNNRRKLSIGGAIQMEVIEPLDVLVDTNSVKKYFKDGEIFCRRKGIQIDRARKYLSEKFKIDPNKISADSDGIIHKSLLDRSKNRNIYGGDEYVTLYEFEYRKLYTDKTKLSDEMEIDVPEEYKKVEPEVEKETNTYFKALWMPGLGCIDHKVNPYKQYSLTPYYDQQSRLRVYPKMRSEYFWVLQDVNNIGKTLLMDNARQQNIIRLFIAAELAAEYGEDTMARFLRAGGIFTVKNVDDLGKMMKEVEGPGLKPEVYDLFKMASEDLRNISQRTNPMDGEFPKNRLASRTVNTLIGQSRKALNGLDTNIGYAAVKESQLICKIVRNELTDDQILEMTGGKKTALNGKMSLMKYQELVQANKSTIEEFEETNDVRYLYPKLPTAGTVPTISPAEIAKRTVVVINPLYHNDKVSIQVKMKFGADLEKYDRTSALSYLFDNPQVGMAVFPLLLDALGFETEKPDIMEKVKENDRYRFIVDAITQAGPEGEAAVMQVLQQLKTGVVTGNPGAVPQASGNPLAALKGFGMKVPEGNLGMTG